jgi:hypothetical protein
VGSSSFSPAFVRTVSAAELPPWVAVMVSLPRTSSVPFAATGGFCPGPNFVWMRPV